MLWPDGPLVYFTHEETEAHSVNRPSEQIFIEHCAWDTLPSCILTRREGNNQIDNCSDAKAGWKENRGTGVIFQIKQSKESSPGYY